MNKNFLTKAAIAAIAVAALSGAQSVHAADTNASLTIQNFTSINSTPSVGMTPLLSEFEDGVKEVPNAIALNVVTNNRTGCKVTAAAGAGDNRSNLINPGDIELITGETVLELSTTAANLWNTPSAVVDGETVSVDLRIKNLRSYTAVAGSSKTYNNTITFTVVPNP